ncbi:hypothetical protein ACRAWF_33700 [Streptomyces sp. L7]
MVPRASPTPPSATLRRPPPARRHHRERQLYDVGLDDQDRIAYLDGHVRALRGALEAGVDGHPRLLASCGRSSTALPVGGGLPRAPLRPRPCRPSYYETLARTPAKASYGWFEGLLRAQKRTGTGMTTADAADAVSASSSALAEPVERVGRGLDLSPRSRSPTGRSGWAGRGPLRMICLRLGRRTSRRAPRRHVPGAPRPRRPVVDRRGAARLSPGRQSHAGALPQPDRTTVSGPEPPQGATVPDRGRAGRRKRGAAVRCRCPARGPRAGGVAGGIGGPAGAWSRPP